MNKKDVDGVEAAPPEADKVQPLLLDNDEILSNYRRENETGGADGYENSAEGAAVAQKKEDEEEDACAVM